MRLCLQEKEQEPDNTTRPALSGDKKCTSTGDCWALDTNLVCVAQGRGEIDTKLVVEEEVESSGTGGEETVLEAEKVEIVKQNTEEGSKCECRANMKWNKE